jgi:hypothetical protein
MEHRHLNHQRLTLAALDDTISRGLLADWTALRAVVLQDAALMDKVAHVCQAHLHDPYAQRYYFWMNYVKEHRTAA